MTAEPGHDDLPSDEELQELAGHLDDEGSRALEELVIRQVTERERLAHELTDDLMRLEERDLRRAAAFTLRCDEDCLLAMVLGKRIDHRWSPPNNELVICWTRKGWRADLLRWYTRDHGLDRWFHLAVACKHGSGFLSEGMMQEFVCHPGPEAARPDTLFPYGATRRLGDHLVGLTGAMTRWGTGMISPNAYADETVGGNLLGSSWRPRTSP